MTDKITWRFNNDCKFEFEHNRKLMECFLLYLKVYYRLKVEK